MIHLDWSDSDHWSGRPGRCAYCGRFTHLIDDAGRPAHKVCVERALEDLTAARKETA